MILTVITVWDFRTSGQANNLRQNAVELSANIRRAQTLSQSGGTVSVCLGTTTKCPPTPVGCDCQKITPSGGFGLNVSGVGATEYAIFADMASVGFPDGDGLYNSADDVIVDEGPVGLTDQVSFCSVSTNVVTFKPPRGNVVQSGVHTYFLKHNAISNTFRKITLNSLSGLIEEGSSTTCS